MCASSSPRSSADQSPIRQGRVCGFEVSQGLATLEGGHSAIDLKEGTSRERALVSREIHHDSSDVVGCTGAADRDSTDDLRTRGGVVADGRDEWCLRKRWLYGIHANTTAAYPEATVRPGPCIPAFEALSAVKSRPSPLMAVGLPVG